MAKLILYNLEADGTIPSYVTDGGYLANPNDNPAPRDYDLVGVATSDQLALKAFDSELELLAYAQTFLSDSLEDADGKTILLADIVQEVWQKVDASDA